MFRLAFGLGLVAVSIALSGCTMCQHPYDYCGPVYDSGCSTCSTHSRAGSILESGPYVGGSYESELEPQPAKIEETIEEPQPQEQGYVKGKTRLGDVPGSERVLSVTERVVKPAGESAESSQIVEGSRPTSSNTSSGAGWTARRPTSDMRR